MKNKFFYDESNSIFKINERLYNNIDYEFTGTLTNKKEIKESNFFLLKC